MTRRSASLAVGAVLLASLVQSCGAREEAEEPSEPLTFEQIKDTTGLSKGRTLLSDFEPYRMENGVIRVRGKLDFPDGTVLQLAISPAGATAPITRVQFEVWDGRFDTPPIIGADGPLPKGKYRFQLITYFDSAWQPAEVVEETHSGRDLRGPGMTRGANGEAAFAHHEDHIL